jgi:hypothetical protein
MPLPLELLSAVLRHVAPTDLLVARRSSSLLRAAAEDASVAHTLTLTLSLSAVAWQGGEWMRGHVVVRRPTLAQLHCLGAQFPAARCFSFVDPSWNMGDSFVAAVASFFPGRVEEVRLLVGGYVSDDAVVRLERHPSLRAFTLEENTLLTCASAQALATIQSLSTLSLAGCERIGDLGVAAFAAHPSLTSVSFERTWAADEGVRALASCRSLRRLILRNCLLVTDDGVGGLANHPALTEVDLSGCVSVGDPGAQALATLPRLERLGLASCVRVGQDGVEALLALPALSSLTLDGLEVVDLHVLSSLTTLTSLSVAACFRLRDESVAALASLPLVHLDLEGCGQLTDAALHPFVRHPTLEVVNVARCHRLTAASAAAIASCPMLRRATVWGCAFPELVPSQPSEGGVP